MSARLDCVRPLLWAALSWRYGWRDGKRRDLWHLSADRKRTSSAYWRGPPRWNANRSNHVLWPSVTGKGEDPAQWPADLRVQDRPQCETEGI